MPIYCYKCENCGNEWESFTHTVDNQDKECPECGYSDIHRNYGVETKVIFADIPPHYDFSIGQWVSGRRDRLSKYKAMGFVPLHGADGGDTVKPFKSYYEDEKASERLVSKKNPIDYALDEALSEGSEDIGDIQE